MVKGFFLSLLFIEAFFLLKRCGFVTDGGRTSYHGVDLVTHWPPQALNVLLEAVALLCLLVFWQFEVTCLSFS